MVLLHRDGAVLLQHRDGDATTYAAGMWGLFGGHVEPGETPEAAAIREIEEELELRLAAPLPLIAHRIDDGRERFVYEAPLEVSLDALVLREGQGMALVPIADLAGRAIVPVHRDIIDAFFEASSP